LITLTAVAQNKEKQPSLSKIHTNWDDFICLVNEKLTLNVALKTEEDIETAVKFLNDTIQLADCKATPDHPETPKAYKFPIQIKQKIELKMIPKTIAQTKNT
jgi:hypothetical protein